jgi:predicted lipoprotein
MTDRPDKITRRQTLAAMLATGMAPALARSAHAAERDYAAFNSAFAQRIMLPALNDLAGAAAAFRTAVEAFLAGSDDAAFVAVRQGFDALADAWASAQQFRIGPLANEQRAERFAYWPERRNIVEKQLNALLAGTGEEGLASGEFADGSVAVQGLPALERILFAEDSAGKLRDGAEAARLHAVLLAIARNLEAIAQEAVAAWRAELADPVKSGLLFAAAPAEGTAQAFTNLLTILQIVADQKIGAVLGGADAASAKPKSAEQWRSGRSLRNIRLNLATARRSALDDGGFATLLAADQSALRHDLAKGFDGAIAAAANVGDDLPAAVGQPEMRKSVTNLLVSVNHLRDLLRQQVPPAIGITLGFNELDGDGS